MMVFTEAMARMVASLAEAGGEMEIELHDDHVRIGYSPRKKGEPAGRIKPAAKRGGGSGKAKLYKALNEKTGQVERHTVKEWREIVGDGSSLHTMYQRIVRTGVAGTAKRRSKFEKSDAKKRIST